MAQLRDLAHRIEIEPVAGRVRAEVGDDVLADSTDVLVLREGKLPERFYFPPEDVNTGALTPSDAHTSCPFKGEASYYDYGDQREFAWYYPEPIASVEAIRGRIAFYGDRVTLVVDG